jgi:hypothetical protein
VPKGISPLAASALAQTCDAERLSFVYVTEGTGTWRNNEKHDCARLLGFRAFSSAEKLAFALVFGWRSGLPLLLLFLGGAAVYRCDKRLIFSAGFSR